MSIEETDILQSDNHRSALARRSDLARRHGEAGDAATAAATYAELLPAMLQEYGPDHPHTLATRAHLAWWRSRTPAGDPHAMAQ